MSSSARALSALAYHYRSCRRWSVTRSSNCLLGALSKPAPSGHLAEPGVYSDIALRPLPHTRTRSSSVVLSEDLVALTEVNLPSSEALALAS